MVTKRQALRAVVLCLVLVAAVKLLLSEYRTERKQKLAIMDPGSFWHQGPNVKEAVTVHKSEVINYFVNWAQKTEVPEPPVEKGADTVPLETSKVPARIVHLDLKGAAPKVKYIKQIFPLFSSLGADGVLLEYEDMFPYHGNLTILRSPYAYSMEDIEEIKSLAKLNKLELIPLVQVFGHLEFVLKHERYFHLREVRAFPNSLNPHHPGSVALVKDMVSQVMDCHPDARWFHMGADEVRGLGESQDSKNWLHSNKGDVGKMFLNHAVSLARFITERRSGVRVILWDDMLRKISPSTIKESGLQDLASPTIWNYLKKMDTDGIGTLISRYHEAGFKGVWFASAFKGGTGIDQRWTPLDYQLQNHLSWIKVMNSMTKYPNITLHGILLTGWQRFEHHTVLCELLPVGIPSLAMCLQSLKHGAFDEKAKMEAHHILGCNIKVEKDICEGSGAFSGSQIYHMVFYIHTNLQKEVEALMKHYHIKGGFSRYHRKYNFANPRIIGFFQGRLKKLLDKWETYIENFRMEMEGIYFPDTVEEWMEENVNANMDLLRENARDAERILKLNGQPKSLKTL
ncbi:hexosaminidase D isoform X1 [Salvelinus alpinus]|uniref:hexosaminidase D isoform X1 n=2 Tax=Salvelinus alpinus TaxID=8036 RepID=UPI0039FDB8B1